MSEFKALDGAPFYTAWKSVPVINNDDTQKAIHSIINDDLDIYTAYIVSGDSIDIKLPEEYQILFRTIAYCIGSCEKLPKIELVIDYDDLQGVHYTDIYKLSIDIVFCNYLNEGRDHLKYVIEPSKWFYKWKTGFKSERRV